MLQRFLQRTGEGQIKKTVDYLEESLKRLPKSSEDPKGQKIRRAIEDNLETSRARLANLQKARDNSELVQVEIDRLDIKICSLSE